MSDDLGEEISAPRGLGGSDEPYVVKFSGVILEWMETLQDDLKGAETPADVARIGIELLHDAKGRDIYIQDREGGRPVRLWKRSARDSAA